MYDPNDGTQNYPFCRLQLVVEILENELYGPINQNSIEITKGVKLKNKKRYCKTLGTSIINSPMSPHSLILLYLLIWNNPKWLGFD